MQHRKPKNLHESFDVISRIKELMELRGWSETELSKRSGITQSTISSWLAQHKTPGTVSIERICAGFGITITEFFMTDRDKSVYLTDIQKKLVKASLKLSDKTLERLIRYINSL